MATYLYHWDGDPEFEKQHITPDFITELYTVYTYIGPKLDQYNAFGFRDFRVSCQSETEHKFKFAIGRHGILTMEVNAPDFFERIGKKENNCVVQL